jgi:hypothetical protein
MNQKKLNQEILEKICGYIREGLPIKSTAYMVYIQPRTLFYWLEAGEKDATDGINSIESQLFFQFHRALSEWELSLIREIKSKQSIQHQWTNLAWLLERRLRDNWSLNTDRQIQDNRQVILNMSKEEIKELLEKLENQYIEKLENLKQREKETITIDREN